jgi:hypothetical protein
LSSSEILFRPELLKSDRIKSEVKGHHDLHKIAQNSNRPKGVL